MILGELADAVTAHQLGWEWLLQQVEPVSDYGRRNLARRGVFVPGQEAQAEQSAQRACEVARVLGEERIDQQRETLRNLPDVGNVLGRAGMGDVLSDVQLFELQRFCDAVERLNQSDAAIFKIPADAASQVVRLLRPGRSGTFSFFLKDAFSEQLTRARNELAAAQAAFDASRARLGAGLAQALGRAEIAGTEFIVMRSDVSAGLPRGLRVVREAPTYFLCELELNEEALRALGRRDEASATLARVESEVRASLSGTIAEHAAELERAAELLGEIDVLLAVARFTLRFQCVAPSYLRSAKLVVTGARFLPLQDELRRHNRAYTPIDFELSGPTLITGPNMGGKSAVLQTAGFISLCAAVGIPVPASSARVCLFAKIVWLGTVAHEDAGGLLSSYAREVVRLKESLAALASPALFLIDEFARTTTAQEGRALLIGLIDYLSARKACAFIATHLSGIAQTVRAKHYAVRGLREHPPVTSARDLETALRTLGEAMDYAIEEVDGGAPPRSDALYLAQALGLEKGLIERARLVLDGEVAPQAKRN